LTPQRRSRTVEPDSAEAAFARGTRLLAIRPRGRAELARDLERRGFRGSAVAAAVEKLEAAGWLEDLAAARSLVRTRADRYGRGRIGRELAARGFDAETAARALEEMDAAHEAQSLERAFSRAWKRAGAVPLPERRARVRRSLLAKGFAAEAISAMIRGSNEIDRGPGEVS
jgi:regulatory protein